jgi:chromosome segregation ATPase
VESTQQAVAEQVKTMQQTVDQTIATLQDRVTQAEKAGAELQGDLSVVTKKLRITQAQLKTAREEAAKMIDETSEKVTELDTSVKGELATKASTDDVKNVDTKVGGVRTDLDSTRDDLKMARSEMGTLIARNHDEIDQLRRLGERDYFEFTVAGKGKSQKVANVTIEFRAANEKKSQFTVALIVDDKRFEKKNRALNEPIFFYPVGTRQAEEVVVNKVGRNEISGYVSIPKANSQATAAQSSGK